MQWKKNGQSFPVGEALISQNLRITSVSISDALRGDGRQYLAPGYIPCISEIQSVPVHNASDQFFNLQNSGITPSIPELSSHTPDRRKHEFDVEGDSGGPAEGK